MRKHLLLASLALICLGPITSSYGQDGPKESKKERKAIKKVNKMEKKEGVGTDRKAMRKKEKAVKKIDKAEMKDQKSK